MFAFSSEYPAIIDTCELTAKQTKLLSGTADDGEMRTIIELCHHTEIPQLVLTQFDSD